MEENQTLDYGPRWKLESIGSVSWAKRAREWRDQAMEEAEKLAKEIEKYSLGLRVKSFFSDVPGLDKRKGDLKKHRKTVQAISDQLSKLLEDKKLTEELLDQDYSAELDDTYRIAVEEGDFEMARKASGLLERKITKDEYVKIGKNAESLGKYSFARKAYEAAGEDVSEKEAIDENTVTDKASKSI